MWYEILPSFGIIGAAITVPPIFTYYFQKLCQNGNPYRRDLRTNPFDLSLFRRDNHLTGSPYIVKGLESLPDSD